MSKGKRDLFDVLGISIREDSYTTLLANLFNEKHENQDWARAYFREVLDQPPPAGPVEVRSRLHLQHESSRKSDIPDLVLVFGNPVTDVWVVEAKIKSGESSDQLRRYEQEAIRSKILDKFDLKDIKPDQVDWCYYYLTLEREEPTELTKFRPITYEHLRKILPANPDLARELFPAYSCLRCRLVDYYTARDEVLKGDTPSDDMPLGSYLSDIRGLVDKRNRFHWLMERIAKDLNELQVEFGVAQGKAFANPYCQIRSSYWRGKNYREDEGSLRECFDIHLELQLVGEKDVSFVLHYETNPYMSGLNNKEGIPGEQRRDYWELRRKFAEALDQHRVNLEDVEWKLAVPRSWRDPPPRSSNQLAKRPNFNLSGTVGSFREWVIEGAKTISPLIDNSVEETLSDL